MQTKSTADLLSPEYREMQAQMHRLHPEYGSASVKWAPTVEQLIKAFSIESVLDYGAGKGRLLSAIDPSKISRTVQFQLYEPSHPTWSKAPDAAELVCCLDVAEHVEPQYTDDFLDDLQRLTQRILLITIHCGPAVKTLPDGRNAHLVQEPPSWWMPKLMSRFNLVESRRTMGGFVFIGEALNIPKAH